ncbi:MAG: HNH endonuclease [Cyanobacteria bacterium P01_B01_bin.77]
MLFENLELSKRDLSIFQIEDTKTRLNTLQNYFFPRLEILLTETIRLVQVIYDVNPYEKMTILRTPRHRPKALNKDDRPYVRIGLGGKRGTKKLRIKKKDGNPYIHNSGRLYFFITPEGYTSVYIYLLGIYPKQNSEVIKIWKDFFNKYFCPLNNIFLLNHISHQNASQFIPFNEVLEKRNITEDELLPIVFTSVDYFFPISFKTGIFELQLAFVALYPLLEASIDIDNGIESDVSKMFEKYERWYIEKGARSWWQENVDTDQSGNYRDEFIELPRIDSYRFTKPGLWWEILARDQWTCCSCGRSVKEHGVTLHVDHIMPRSRGGTDAPENLQALCMKCNIGKSNKDATVLSPNV